MWFEILGPMRVTTDGVTRPVAGVRQRTVLGALLANANKPVTAAHLAEIVWDGAAPDEAVPTLRTYVMRLRHSLGPQVAARILTQDYGYLAQVSEDEFDALSFEALCRRVGAAVRASEWAQAADDADRALNLWHGEPLADIPCQALREAWLPRLEQQHLQTWEWHAEAGLHLGRHEQLVQPLRALTVAHPFREPFHAQLMLALHRCGRQAEALAAYQDARRVLVEELGIEPGSELRAMHARILATDGEPSAPPQVGSALASRPPRKGVPARSGSHDRTPVAAAGVRSSLPPDTAAFTGRGAELAAIAAAVPDPAGACDEGGGVVAIRAIGGMPGVGKTALAVHAAHMLAARFPDRQLFVDLHGHTPGREPVAAGDALASLLAAVGVDARSLPADADARAALWRDRMAGQRALLLLDNAASSAQVAQLLPGGGCLVVVTSRRHLADLPGVVVPVPVEVLPPQEAAQMFIRLAPQAAGEDPCLVAELVQLAGFLPLAVSLLARMYNRHRTWAMADLISETRQRLLALTAEQASVEAALEVSWQHLDPAQQEFLALLGLHPAETFDSYAAAALAEVSVRQAEVLLDGLNGEGLLTEIGCRRYGMHDLIRQHAAARALADLPSAVRAAALCRILEYYQLAAGQAESQLATFAAPAPAAASVVAPELTGEKGALGWLRAERASILACIDYSVQTGDPGRVVGLTAGLASLLYRDGPHAEAVTRHTAAVRAARALGDPAVLAAAMTNLGTARGLAGDSLAAVVVLEEAVGICRGAGELAGLAAALTRLGDARAATGDYPGAAIAAEEAVGLFSAAGDRRGQATALRTLGQARYLAADYPAAAAALTQALRISGDLGDQYGCARALIRLGRARLSTGDHSAATRDLGEALRIYEGLGDRQGQAEAHIWLGEVRREAGDYPAAARDLSEALCVFGDMGDHSGQASALLSLGCVRRDAGEYPAADRDLSDALRIYRDIGERGAEAEALNEIGSLHLALGDHAAAAGWHRQALVVARQIGNPGDEACAQAGLGRAALVAGDATAARVSLTLALDLFRQAGAAQADRIATELAAIPTAEPGPAIKCPLP